MLMLLRTLEANVVEAGGSVPDEDHLVDQMPLQYHCDPSPPRPFYFDPGASSSSAPLPPAIHERQDQFAASLSVMATDLYSLIPNNDDDDDDDYGDDGDFPPDSSTTSVFE
ncbi:hypothetical protein F0562_019611 [Nyssa sinensis]|uniref:Uncharacterized protein n=1 Tax=Nyssa sinensis TaxID=561372 RepID=A0A5J5BPN7_9ASTE|nr:hypothetical protein F0562_019611 [Nyssa sinensis]